MLAALLRLILLVPLMHATSTAAIAADAADTTCACNATAAYFLATSSYTLQLARVETRQYVLSWRFVVTHDKFCRYLS